MPVIQVEAQLTSEQLLNAVKQLSEEEREQFFEHLVEWRSQDKLPRLSLTESELLARINQSLSLEVRERYHELTAKRRALLISDEEYEELLRLTDEVEKADAERIRCLMELARLRKVPLDELIRQMGILPQPYE